MRELVAASPDDPQLNIYLAELLYTAPDVGVPNGAALRAEAMPMILKLRARVLTMALATALSCATKPTPLPAADASPATSAALSGELDAGAPEARDASDAAVQVPSGPLPKDVADRVLGCWKNAETEERWRFARTPQGDVEGVREIADPLDDSSSDYARRARIPRPLKYDPAAGTLEFPAAGRIHGLMFVFKPSQDTLTVFSFSSRVPGEAYHPTGSRFTMARCAN